MKPKRVKLAYFSPTGTTEKVLSAIGRGLGKDLFESAEMVDMTSPEVRSAPLYVDADELLVVGAPVYMGRIPALMGEWLSNLKCEGGPAVCVVVYGNRAFEDSLLELSDVVAEAGCTVVAGGAFIGEHSFSAPERPTAQGRPDMNDMGLAESFGRSVLEKLEQADDVTRLSKPAIPGNYPYGGRTQLWDVDFIAVDDSCVQCGLCAEVCPVGAVDPGDSRSIDAVKCITCCACIKKCPQQARSIKPGPVQDAQIRLNTLFGERREPEVFV